MSNNTTLAANNTADYTYRAVAYALPAAFHYGLFTVSPTDAGGGTEASYVGYARVSVTRNTTNFAAGASKKTSNVAAMVWTAVPSGTLVVTAIGEFDAASAGNLLRYKVLDNPITFSAGQAPQLAAGFWEVTF